MEDTEKLEESVLQALKAEKTGILSTLCCGVLGFLVVNFLKKTVEVMCKKNWVS